MSAYARARVYQTEMERELQRFLDGLFADGHYRRVLDAGCGFQLPVDFPDEVHLIGLDASAAALAKNENIDEAIVGRIDDYPLPAGEFDVVLCWWVLEHLARPRAAFLNMAQSLRPGGLLIIGVPRLWSLKGLLTKLTPHRLHVWAYRHVFGFVDAGAPGVGPFRTYLHRDITPKRMKRIALTAQLEQIYAKTGGATPLGLPGWMRVLWSLASGAARVVSFGKWNAQASEHVAVFRKASG